MVGPWSTGIVFMCWYLLRTRTIGMYLGKYLNTLYIELLHDVELKGLDPRHAPSTAGKSFECLWQLEPAES